MPRIFEGIIDTTIYDQAVTAYYQTDNRLHHALTDARAYQRGWLVWTDDQKKGCQFDS